MAAAAALADRARALHRQGRLPEAARGYEAALAARPAAPLLAELTALLGALRVQQGQTAAGAKLLQRAAALRPEDAGAHYNLGVALLRLGRAPAAAVAFAAVLARQPDHADAWKHLGDTRQQSGAFLEAIAAYRTALAWHPDHPGALGQLGGLLSEAGAPGEAEPLLRRALALRPHEPALHNNLGLALEALGQPAAAEAALRQALDLRPDYALAMENLGNLLLQLRRPAEAEPLLRQAVAAAPNGERLGGLLAARAAQCAWDGQAALLAWTLAAPPPPPHPFALLCQPVPPVRLRQLAAAHAAVVARAAPALPKPLSDPPAIRRDGPIRLGYLSSDLQSHAIGYLVAEVLERHDRAAFDLRAYAAGADDGSATRRRLAAALPFVEAAPLGAAALAQRIAADGIELLVELNGWTRGHRQDALVGRPAAIQATWLGFPGTTGASWLDYAIVDAVVAPDDRAFSEALVRLPHCYQPNDRQRMIGAAPTPPAPGLVLCCFCQPQKISPPIFALWLRILLALPGSVLWLLEPGAPAEANLRREAAARGVAPERLVFAPLVPLAEHLARYRAADLALDSLPYGSHTTASDALWAGCPFLGLTGEGFAGRVSTSILCAAGLGDCAFAELPAYEAAAVALGRDPPALARLRARVAGCRTAPLFDTPRFVAALETGYRAMVERNRAGLPPAAIDLPA